MAAPQDVLDRVYDLLGDDAVMMLTTRAPEGYLRTRPMQLQRRDDGIADLWFATYPQTHKVSDIDQNPDVCLSYYSPTNQAWVSIAGRAELTRNDGALQKVWNEGMRPWFPGGPDDPAIMLLKVHASHVEYCESPSGPIGVVWQQAKAVVTGEQPRMPQVQRVDIAS